MKTLFRLYKTYATLDLLWFLRDTRYCLTYIISDLICLSCSMAGVFLLAIRFDGFGGMSQSEVLFMLGYSAMVDGLYSLFFIGNNAGMISRIIGRGQLDHCMIQPAPLWMQLIAQGFSPLSGSLPLFAGIGLTCYAVSRLSLSVTPLWLLLLFVNTVASCIILVAVIYLLSCLAFYAPAAAEEIAQSGVDLFSMKSYPLGGLFTRVQATFCIFIPVGLGAWFPSQALLTLGYSRNLAAWPSLLAVPMAAIVFTGITTYFFQKGLTYYATYGSPRYSGFGHR